MTWFKVDDGFWSHPKVAGLSAEAVALWVRAGSYAAQHLTDGYVARHVLPMLRGIEEHAEELVGASLWRPMGDGWTFHDWHRYQPLRAEVEERRSEWRGRQQKSRMSRGDTQRDSRSDTQRDSRVTPGRDGMLSVRSTPFPESRGDTQRDSRGDRRGLTSVPPTPADRTVAEALAVGDDT